jgi:DNA-binding CsgD family transcriptional regulator
MSNSFFNSLNMASGISQDDYARANEYVRALKSMAKIAYESIYVIDYFAMDFLYVSDNPLFLCGLTPEEVMKLGYDFYATHVPEEELDMLLKVNSLGFRFFNSQPVEERDLLSISYDFHIVNNGVKFLVNHKLTPLAMDSNGHMWLGVCYVSISNHDKPGNIEIRKIGQSSFWRYDMLLDRWMTVEGVKLSIGEKEVLLLSAQGMTVDEIAKQVNRSKDSIKSRRRSIFEKLGVKSISEALAFVRNYKLI